MDNTITVSFFSGTSVTLRPASMRGARPHALTARVPGSLMSDDQRRTVQSFMQACGTDVLTDGRRMYVVSGRMLAYYENGGLR